MTDESKKLLFDVQEAAASVLRYTEGGSLSEFAASRMMRRAVEREFEIMGEALNRLSRLLRHRRPLGCANRRNTGFQPVRPPGFQPGVTERTQNTRLKARWPHRLKNLCSVRRPEVSVTGDL
jgi:hypothetical protein